MKPRFSFEKHQESGQRIEGDSQSPTQAFIRNLQRISQTGKSEQTIREST